VIVGAGIQGRLYRNWLFAFGQDQEEGVRIETAGASQRQESKAYQLVLKEQGKHNLKGV